MINCIVNLGQKSIVDCVPDNTMQLLRDAAQQQDDIGPTSLIAGKIDYYGNEFNYNINPSRIFTKDNIA